MNGTSAPVAPGYPVSLSLAGRRVVVVGGGRVATRRVADLVAIGADVHVVAPRISAELAARAEGGEITASRRPFQAGDLDAAWLVFAATDDPDVNREVAAAADRRRCFVSCAQGGASSCTPMAVLRRGSLEVAVGTSGRSPAFASWLRRRLEGHVGPEYGVLLDLAADVRAELHAGGRTPEATDWHALFDSGILDQIRAGDIEDAREELRTCLSS